MELDIDVAMTDLALDIVGRTIFNADVESEASEIRDVLEAGMRVFHRFLLPGGELLWHLPLPATRGFTSARDDFDRMMLALIRSRNGAAQDPPDLIDHLIMLEDDGGDGRLSETEIRDEAVTLLLAGHETTARALTWAWHLLTLYPDAAGKLRAELGEVLGDRPPTAADYARLPYTRAVFCETLRLYPPVWALARIATREVDLGHLVIPDGGTVIMSQWVMHRDPQLFEHALAFRPERWLGRTGAASGCLLPVRRRPAPVYRGALRDARGRAGAGHAGAALAGGGAGRSPRIDARFTLRPRGGLRARIRAA